jgi:hypothetical protein
MSDINTGMVILAKQIIAYLIPQWPNMLVMLSNCMFYNKLKMNSIKMGMDRLFTIKSRTLIIQIAHAESIFIVIKINFDERAKPTFNEKTQYL